MLVGSASAASQIDITVGTNKIGSNNLSLSVNLFGEESAYTNTPALRQLARDFNSKMVRLLSYCNEPCTRWSDATKTGSFNWANVDLLIQRIFEIGAQPLITLGYHNAYAGWKLPPGMGLNPATGLPYPDSFAAYCTQWVSHFKSTGASVRVYEIINEPWSYFGWNNYTKMGYYKTLFNAAAGVMMAVNPNVLVSFDGSNRKPVLTYWLSNGGADLGFISFHKYDASVIGQFTDATMLNKSETNQLQTDPYYYGVVDARQTYYNARGKWLPVINSESNFNSAYATGTDPKIQQMVGAVWTALVLRTGILVGLNYNCYYTFANSASYAKAAMSSGGLGFAMINTDNNQPWYPYYVYKMIGNNLALGDSILETTNSLPDVRSIAWLHGTKLNILLICKVDQSRVVQLHGLQGLMNYSKIDNTISWQTPRVQTGSVDPTQPISMNGYTVMLLQDDISTPATTFADGFESGSFSAWNGVITTSGETATIVNTVKHSGTYSARLASNGNGGFEGTYSYKNVASSSDLYTRGYFYVATSGISSNDNRFYFTILRAGGNPVAYAGWRKVGGVVKWNLLIRDGSGWASASSASSPSMNQWYSVELHWKEGSSNGLGELFVNGALVCSISSKNTAYYGDVTRVNFGLAEIYNCATTQVYSDDLAISSTRIGP